MEKNRKSFDDGSASQTSSVVILVVLIVLVISDVSVVLVVSVVSVISVPKMVDCVLPVNSLQLPLQSRPDP